jgi:fructose-1,6-bisphosphatase/inositol monophosphatase family enzyme
MATGSAAQNMCHVAAGVADVYFEDRYGGPWDVCAGTVGHPHVYSEGYMFNANRAQVIVREAGGEVYDLNGEHFVLRSGPGETAIHALSFIHDATPRASTVRTQNCCATRSEVSSRCRVAVLERCDAHP